MCHGGPAHEWSKHDSPSVRDWASDVTASLHETLRSAERREAEERFR